MCHHAPLSSLLLLALACNSPLPPAPPPFAGAPPPPPTYRSSDQPHPSSPPDATSTQPPSLVVAAVATASSQPHPSPQPQPSLTLETPYKLGEQLSPRGQAEQAELDRWNKGSGNAQPPPEPTGHPFPRVIVDIQQVKGPLKARDVERIARRDLWNKIVECYRLGAYKDPSLRGKTTLRLSTNRSGKVTSAKQTASTLPDSNVVSCLVRQVKTLTFSSAKRGSSIVASIQIAPGDKPMEPPASEIRAGDGTLPSNIIVESAKPLLPRLKSCYESALVSTPSLWGRLAVRLHITTTGQVDEAFEVESRFPDAQMTQCVLKAARHLTFPAPTGGDLRLVLPLRFFVE